MVVDVVVLMIGILVRFGQPEYQAPPDSTDVAIVIGPSMVGEVVTGKDIALSEMVDGIVEKLFRPKYKAKIAVFVATKDKTDELVPFLGEFDMGKIKGQVAVLNNLHYVIVDLNKDGPTMMANIKKTIQASGGNRPAVPDILVWIAPAAKELGDELKDVLDLGLDVMIVRSTGAVKTITQGDKDHVRSVRPEDYEKMTDLITDLLQLCTETVSASPCYWADNRRKQCNTDITYHYHGGEKKYCRDGTETGDCALGVGQCEIECQQAQKKPGVCSVTCGTGDQPLKRTNTSKYYECCPPDSQRCTGPPCPPTTTTSTPKKTSTKTRHRRRSRGPQQLAQVQGRPPGRLKRPQRRSSSLLYGKSV